MRNKEEEVNKTMGNEHLPPVSTKTEKLVDATTESAETTPSAERFSWKHFTTSALTWLFRLCVGGVFVYSGFVKAIDPWGTIYKMQDYLASFPSDISALLSPLLSVGSFALFSFEFLIGVFLLTGSYRRISTVGAALLMLVMLPLTLWIALTDPVADCGCFGDALIISNWATFWKNVVLTLMIAWLLKLNNRCRCLVHPTLQWLLFAASLTYIITIGFIGYSVQPLVDFRPYAVGETLIDQSEESGDGMMAIWQKGRQQVTLPMDSIPEEEGWEFIDRIETEKSEAASDVKHPKDKGIAIFDDAEEVTDDVIEQKGEQVIVTMYDLPDISSATFYELNSLYSYCQAHDIPMMTVAAATPIQIEDFIDKSLAEYPIYTAEDTAIKEIVRGNPAVIYLDNGKIIWKYSLQSIATDDFMKDTPDAPRGLMIYLRDTGSWLQHLTLAIIIAVAVLIFLSQVPMVIRLCLQRRNKSKYSRFIKDGNVVKLLFVALSLSLSLISCHHDKNDEPPTATEPKSQAVLFYMVATNNLKDNAIEDLHEMVQGFEAVNGCSDTDFIVYVTHPIHDYPIMQRLTMKNGEAQFEIIKEYKDRSISSVDPIRIREVIEDFSTLTSAERKGLVLWSHSTAWLPGNLLPLDESMNCPVDPVFYSYGDDMGKTLSIPELAAAIPDNYFEFIWCDCCDMGNVETLYQLRHDCQYYVASPTEVMGEGLPYVKVVSMMAVKDFSLADICSQVYDYYLTPRPNGYPYYSVAITDASYLSQLAVIAREILAPAPPEVSTIGLQYYCKAGERANPVYFYDAMQLMSRMAEMRGIDEASLQTWFASAINFKCTTSAFQNIPINPSLYSGLSLCIYSRLSNEMKTEYRRLDWYKDTYQS